MADYNLMTKQLAALTENVEYDITNLANASALIWDGLDCINWAGFYIMRDGKLVLGPFQGKVACTSIEVGNGVCGTAVERDETIVVDNVHEFPGHIACDSASNSEIVIPIHGGRGKSACKGDDDCGEMHKHGCERDDECGEIYGVLDIDSPELSRFTEEDRQGLEALVEVLERRLTEK